MVAATCKCLKCKLGKSCACYFSLCVRVLVFTVRLCFCCVWGLKLTNKVTCCNPLGKYMRAHIDMVTCACLRTHTLLWHCVAGLVA